MDGVDPWDECLSRLIENADERHDRLRALQKWVLREKTIEATAWRWVDARRRIVGHARGGAAGPHARGPARRAKRRR